MRGGVVEPVGIETPLLMYIYVVLNILITRSVSRLLSFPCFLPIPPFILQPSLTVRRFGGLSSTPQVSWKCR